MADAYDEEEPWSWGKRLGVAAAVIVGLGGAGALGWTLLFSGESKPQRQVVNTVTRISLPPPPPPPPPPKVDPPPPVQQPRIQEPQRPLERAQPPTPQPRPQQAPGPPPALGLPAGPGGANPYGIGQGSGDGTVIGGGGGGGGGGSRWTGYGQQAAQAIQRGLQRDECTSRGRYTANTRIWFGPGGEISRSEVVGSSGNPERDRCIERVATQQRVAPPDPQLPQPLIVRITASGS